MEPVPPRQQVTNLTRRALLSGLALAALAPAGCMTRFFTKKDDVKTTAPKGRIVSSWDNKVTYAPDASRGGSVMPGLVGRVYLFGPDMAVPYIGDGKLAVDLYDCTPQGTDSEPKLTDHLELAPEALRRFVKTDFVGEAYTIYFPWFNYRPEVSRVYLVMRYTAANGESYFHQSGVFSVDHSETKEIVKKGISIVKPGAQVSAPQPVQ